VPNKQFFIIRYRIARKFILNFLEIRELAGFSEENRLG